MRHSFSLHRAIGAPEPRRRFTLSERLFSLHRLSGVRELHQRVRPDGRQFFQHRLSGMLELRQRVRPDGRQFFQHRLSGMLELRQRVRPDGAAPFSAPADRGTRTALAGSPLTGGELFAEPQRGVRRLRTAGASRRPPRGQKGRTTCGFPSSLNSCLSLAS